MPNVSRETTELLSRFAALVVKWNPTINLISASTVPDIWERHIRDSVQLFKAAQPKSGTWVDLGSGGGFPGIVIAICARHLDLKVVLIESDLRKCAFLRNVKRELSLEKLDIIASRIESVPRQKADYISARALASLVDLLPNLKLHLKPEGQAWLLKGKNWQTEIEMAQKDWTFDCAHLTSDTDPSAAILNIHGISDERS